MIMEKFIQYILRDALFFPKSSVKIMSVTNMAREYPNEDGSPDREGTYVRTHYDYTVLQWDHGKFSKTFEHPSNNIPECVVNEGIKGFNTYTASMDTKETPVRNIKNTSVFWSNQVAPISRNR